MYSDINSAHTVAKSVQQKAAIQQALTEYFTGNIAGVLTSAAVKLGTGIVNQILTVNMAVNVRFPNDGSTYSFMFKGVIANLNGDITISFEPIINSGRDKGVRLNESGNYADYRASGPNDALQRILQHMIASGVKVTIGDTIYRGGNVTVTRVICSNEPPKGCVAAE
ncbi:hypothetical protein [Pseudoalteromonas sp. MMG022]|uniref:hypothetical protein n=1 Tax=Pseudoalteromonas sp. MMG022 TaxID=2909978 RepID=UPI001F437FFC|nr:hypothetical protein [Pseudoalteromonas sp. MMG022]MCF6434164.1 hypothetical protein [Pseudoalteromonas sp. MMG022]